jgi:hypothetical protein
MACKPDSLPLLGLAVSEETTLTKQIYLGSKEFVAQHQSNR